MVNENIQIQHDDPANKDIDAGNTAGTINEPENDQEVNSQETLIEDLPTVPGQTTTLTPSTSIQLEATTPRSHTVERIKRRKNADYTAAMLEIEKRKL